MYKPGTLEATVKMVKINSVTPLIMFAYVLDTEKC